MYVKFSAHAHKFSGAANARQLRVRYTGNCGWQSGAVAWALALSLPLSSALQNDVVVVWKSNVLRTRYRPFVCVFHARFFSFVHALESNKGNNLLYKPSFYAIYIGSKPVRNSSKSRHKNENEDVVSWASVVQTETKRANSLSFLLNGYTDNLDLL